MDRGGDPDRAGRAGARSGAEARIAAVCLIVALAVSGCSGAGDAEPSPTATNGAPDASSAPATRTPSPGPTPHLTVPPQRPAAMDAVTVEGAVAAAEYFLALYPYVYNTGDLTEWKTLSHPECIFCASVISNVEAMVAAGNHNEGGGLYTANPSGREVEPGAWFAVELTLVQDPSREVDGAGALVDGFPDGGTYSVELAIIHDEVAWLIRGVTLKETS